MRLFVTLSTLMTLIFCSLTAMAQEQGSIRFQSKAEIEVIATDENGQQTIKRVEATTVSPDTEVIYTNLFTNIGQEPAEDITITNPIPKKMVYVDGSAKGKDSSITFSVNNGESFDIPGKLFVLDENGKPRLAGASDFTDIRWQIQTPLPPGETGSVSFRAFLN